MLRRTLLTALIALASPAIAAASEEKKPEVGQYVDLAPVALPIIARGQLINYVFVYVRINLTNGANVPKLREKEPFFRDALIRAAHRTPFTSGQDYLSVDTTKLSAALQRDAQAIAGPGVIRSVVVTSQAPKRRTGVPRPQPN